MANADRELKKVLESFFYAQIFDRDPDDDYMDMAIAEINRLIAAREAALLDRIKDEVIGKNEVDTTGINTGTQWGLRIENRNQLRAEISQSIDNIAKEIRGEV